MPQRSQITVYFRNKDPLSYNLDPSKKMVYFGRGLRHGKVANVPQNDIVIDESLGYVSRSHCSFLFMNGNWYIQDDGSRNGLFFNGERISLLQMHDGDRYFVAGSQEESFVIAFSSGKNVTDSRGARYSLREKNRFVIGRNRECDIVLSHPSVSRQHCVITKESDGWYIADNNSMNGVILNGQLLRGKTKLSSMDRITIAVTSFIFNEGYLYSNEVKAGVSVSANSLYKRVGDKKHPKFITNNVSLSIGPGEFVALIGGSGAGKTTLLNLLSGMTYPTSGSILVNGQDIRKNEKSIRSIMGYVPQNDIVYDNLTLEKMLYYSARLRMPQDTSKEEISKKIDETLEMVELKEHRKTMISKLSGGQRKRASIAVELLASPSLFFLDEPSSGLDPGTEMHLMHLLKRISQSGKTVIMVTHTVQNIDFCDRIVCMGRGGKLCFSGSPSEALSFFGKKKMTDIYDDLNEHSDEISEYFMKTAGRQNEFGNAAIQMEREEKAQKDRKKWHPLAFVQQSIKQFLVMTRRYMELLWNSKPKLVMILLLPLVLASLVCLAYSMDGNLFNALNILVDKEGRPLPFLVYGDTQKIMFTFACAVFWVGIFNSIQEISKEQGIYRREVFSGVRPFPYVLSKLTVLLLICLIQAVIMNFLFGIMCDTTVTLNGDVNSATALPIDMGTDGVVFGSGMLWMEMFLTTFLSMVSAMCLGLMISSAVSNEMAMVLCPICLLPQMLFSGVAASLSGMTETISHFVTSRWACIAYFTSLNVNDMLESCKYGGTGEVTPAPMWAGNYPETSYFDAAYDMNCDLYFFSLDPVHASWTAMAVLSIVCIIAAVCILHYRKRIK